MDRIEQIAKLFQFGWKFFTTIEEAIGKTTPEQLEFLRRLYAAFHGLSGIGDVLSHLNEVRFCKHPDTMQAQASQCRWPDGEITWDVLTPLPNFPGGRQGQIEAVDEALHEWAKVCGIRPQYTPGNPRARIQIGYRLIDGAYGVLAESELPCGNVAVCHQWYDLGDNWAIYNGPRRGSTLDFRRVALHELGHALGMNHIGAGNVLAPVYSDSIWTPQAGDVAEMVARYGPPAPLPPVTPPAADFIIRFADGQLSVDGYRLTKLLVA